MDYLAKARTRMSPRNLFNELRRRILCKITLAFGFVSVCASVCGQNGASIDETARLLAGLPVTGALASFTQSSWLAGARCCRQASFRLQAGVKRRCNLPIGFG